MSAQSAALQPKAQVAALKARVKEAERSGNLQEALRLADGIAPISKKTDKSASAVNAWVYNVGNSLATGRGVSVAPEDKFDRLQQLVREGQGARLCGL